MRSTVHFTQSYLLGRLLQAADGLHHGGPLLLLVQLPLRHQPCRQLRLSLKKLLVPLQAETENKWYLIGRKRGVGR